MKTSLNEISGPEASPILRKAIERTVFDAMNFDLYLALPKHLQENVDTSDYPEQAKMRWIMFRNLDKVINAGDFSEAQVDKARDQLSDMYLATNVNSRQAYNRFAYADERCKF